MLSDIFSELGQGNDVQFLDFSQIVLSNVLYTFKPEDEINENVVRHIVLDSIRSHVLKNKVDYPEIVIAVDSPNKNYWRREMIAPYYKQHRKKQKEESGYDWDKIYSAMNTVVGEIVDNFPYKTLIVDGVEADDVIGYLTRYFRKERDCKVHITSSDGDFTQLQRYGKVRQYDPINKKFVTPKHGSAERDLLYKIVKGDAKDTISNIFMPSDFIISKEEGQRQKSIRKELLASVYESKDPRSLFESEVQERYDENKKLIDFEEIPESICKMILDAYNSAQPKPKGYLNRYFIQSGLTNFIGKENEF